MSLTARSFRSMLSPAGRFFGGAAESFRFASEASRLAETPDHVFQARGTSRDKALRALLNNL